MVIIIMDKPSIEEVIGAIDSLYRGENPADKERASSWLTKLHSSVSVLAFCRLAYFPEVSR